MRLCAGRAAWRRRVEAAVSVVCVRAAGLWRGARRRTVFKVEGVTRRVLLRVGHDGSSVLGSTLPLYVCREILDSPSRTWGATMGVAPRRLHLGAPRARRSGGGCMYAKCAEVRRGETAEAWSGRAHIWSSDIGGAGHRGDNVHDLRSIDRNGVCWKRLSRRRGCGGCKCGDGSGCGWGSEVHRAGRRCAAGGPAPIIKQVNTSSGHSHSSLPVPMPERVPAVRSPRTRSSPNVCATGALERGALRSAL